jgi:hypothetical protein
VRAGEQVVAPTESDAAQLLFGDVVVQAYPPVRYEARQRFPVVEGIGRGLRDLAARRFRGARGDEPALELPEDRKGTFLAKLDSGLGCQLLRVRQMLEAVEPGDELERPGDAEVRLLQGYQRAPGMRLMPCSA